jgi:hypothetical protein
MDVDVFVAYIAAGTALLAALGAIYSNGRMIRANIVSANRQRWIDAIRDDLAVFLNMRDIDHAYEISDGLNPTLAENAQKARREMYLLSRRIELKLNPKEQKHLDFLALIEELRTSRIAQDEDLTDRTVRAAQDIFKTEWERIKNGG